MRTYLLYFHADCPKRIIAVRYGLQMIGPNACSVTTQMIYLHIARNYPPERFIGKAVSKNIDLLTISESPVSRRTSLTYPSPASSILLFYLWPKSSSTFFIFGPVCITVSLLRLLSLALLLLQYAFCHTSLKSAR